jgi:protein CpxP
VGAPESDPSSTVFTQLCVPDIDAQGAGRILGPSRVGHAMEASMSDTKSRRWMKPVLATAAGIVLLGGALGIAHAAGESHGFGPWRHHGMGRDFAEYRLQKALKEVDATDAQHEQIKAILGGVFAKHEAMASAHEQLHAQLLAALSGPTVDRDAIEKVRAQAIARVDGGSRDLAKAIADMADVLTPEQRAQLAQNARNHHLE